MAETLTFNMDAVLQRLLEECYSLLAALPLFLLALVVVAVFWLLGSWLARRQMLDRVARRNPFLRELTRTTVRWVISLIGMLLRSAPSDRSLRTAKVVGRFNLVHYFANRHKEAHMYTKQSKSLPPHIYRYSKFQ